MAGILSSGPSTGMLSQPRQPQSILGRLGIDLTDPSSQIGLAFLNNVISTPDASPFQGVPEAAQNAQVMQQRKVQLAQIVKKQQQEDEQSAQLKKMLAGDPMALQFLNAGQPDEALKVYERNQGLAGGPAPTTDIQNYEYSLSHPGFSQYQTQRGGAAEMGLQPVYMTDANGNIVMGQATKDGRIVQSQMPDGMKIVSPGDIARSKASGAAAGKLGGTTAANLPMTAQTVENALTTIQKARGINPATGQADARLTQGMNDTFGTFLGVIPDQWGPTLPGTAKQDYASVLDQLGGQAFLGAYQQLRGAGAITEVEGQRAGDAVARLNRAQSKDAFLQALDDYEAVLKQGYARLQQQAVDSGGADPSTLPQIGGQGGAGGANDPLGIR